MDNLNVLKKMGRYFASQINEIQQSMQMAEHSSQSTMGLENQLIVDAWNTVSDRNHRNTASAC